jgi:hypothetical protein
MKTYCKLMIEGVNDIGLFERVEPDRNNPDTIAIEEVETTDKSGFTQRAVTKWANFWFCHDEAWGVDNTEAVKQAVIAYELANPGSQIPDDEVFIWTSDGSVSITKLKLLTS